MKELERTLKALANRRRLAILQLLKRRREMCVSDIAEVIKISIKATSKHLAILDACDLLDKEQRSLQMFYRLARVHHSPCKEVLALL